MKPSTNHESEQGSLFAEVETPSAVTEPSLYKPAEVHYEPAPEGSYPEESFSDDSPGASELVASIHDAVVHDHRRKAQLAKHSALEDDGSYSDVRPGKVLPGFGVVKYSNLEAAKRYADSLNATKSKP